MSTRTLTRLITLTAVLFVLALLPSAAALADTPAGADAPATAPAATAPIPAAPGAAGQCAADTDADADAGENAIGDLDGPEPLFLQESCCTFPQYTACLKGCLRALGLNGDCCPACTNNQCTPYCYDTATESCPWSQS